MLKNTFESQLEFDTYIAEQKIRMEKSYLTRFERDQLKSMLEPKYKPTIIAKEITQSKPYLVTDYRTLRKPCELVTKDDNIKEIVEKLKKGVEYYRGLGMTANQIGIFKKISYIRVPNFENKKLEYKEMVLINAKIIEHERLTVVKGEGCISFPGIKVDANRFVFITLEYQNEKLELQTILLQDLTAIVVQHETDHQNGLTLLERRHKAK